MVKKKERCNSCNTIFTLLLECVELCVSFQTNKLYFENFCFCWCLKIVLECIKSRARQSRTKKISVAPSTKLFNIWWLIMTIAPDNRFRNVRISQTNQLSVICLLNHFIFTSNFTIIRVRHQPQLVDDVFDAHMSSLDKKGICIFYFLFFTFLYDYRNGKVNIFAQHKRLFIVFASAYHKQNDHLLWIHR